MEASSVYIAASTNRHSHAADVSSEDLVAFGTGTMIALWQAEGAGDAGVQETLASDHARVTCVRFIAADRLASADEHGSMGSSTTIAGSVESARERGRFGWRLASKSRGRSSKSRTRASSQPRP